MAFDTVVETLSSPSFEQSVGAKGSDIAFLSELLNNTVVQSLIKVRVFFVHYICPNQDIESLI